MDTDTETFKTLREAGRWLGKDTRFPTQRIRETQ
jgi:hypothetical protein